VGYQHCGGLLHGGLSSCLKLLLRLRILKHTSQKSERVSMAQAGFSLLAIAVWQRLALLGLLLLGLWGAVIWAVQ
jgi:hypothetical protein